MGKTVLSNNFLQILDSGNDAVNIQVKNNHSLTKISGVHDENFILLEKISNTKISLRGNLITIKGKKKDTNIITSVVNKLLKKSLEKNHIDDEDVKSLYNFTFKDSQNDVMDLEEKNSDSNYSVKTPKKTVYARTEKQKTYLEILNNNNIIYAIGPAGTGKTFLPVAVAVHKLISGEVNRIILSSPAVEAGENLGFLPGDLKE